MKSWLKYGSVRRRYSFEDSIADRIHLLRLDDSVPLWCRVKDWFGLYYPVIIIVILFVVFVAAGVYSKQQDRNHDSEVAEYSDSCRF